MKRTSQILVGAALLAALAAHAQFQYQLTNGTISITGYTGSGGALTIPSAINGLPVTSIGEGVFYGTALSSVTIPNSVTSIGEAAFEDCNQLANVTIPDTLTSVGDGAFGGCYSLTNITLPESVTSIGDSAFAGSGVTSVTIPGSLTSIGDGAFGACESLTNITVAAQNAFYSSLDGVLFDKSQATLLQFPAGARGNYAIPGGVTSVDAGAFGECGLAYVTIPASVTNIGQAAFENCNWLTAAFFSGNAPAVGTAAFFSVGLAIGPLDATAYYLPRTTGWDSFSTNTGLATVLWNPVIQAGDGNLGVQGNHFGFDIAGATNLPVLVEASTNLANPVWSPSQTLTLTNGSGYFSEALQTNVPGRFYRLDFP